MSKKPTTSDIERRAFNVDGMRVEKRSDTEQRLIVGHAAVFNAETDIGGYFMERVAPGAFARAILEDDVRSLFNHDANFVLGRTKAGTLKLREDGTGLMTETTPPDTQFARDLQISIDRGDISQMSFAFRVKKESWQENGDKWLRTIEDVELFDVSPVTYPAYPTTDVGLRSLAEFRKAHAPQGLTTETAAPTLRREAIQSKSL